MHYPLIGLKNILVAENLTVDEFSNLAKTSITTLNKIIDGISKPRKTTIEKILKAVNSRRERRRTYKYDEIDAAFLYTKKCFDEIETIYLRLLGLFPDDAFVHLALADTLMAAGKLREAQNFYKPTSNKSPALQVSYIRYAEVVSKQLNYHLEWLQQAIALHPSMSFQEAIKIADQNTKLSPSETEALIVRSIEFSHEHFQAGIAILTYFGTILKQKYPSSDAIVRIEQDKSKVRLVINPNSPDEKEIIERTLYEYGMVVTGNMSPDGFLSDPQSIIQLENKLEIAQLELKMTQRQLEFERSGFQKRIANLEDEILWLRSEVGGLLTRSSNEHEKLLEFLLEFSQNRDSLTRSAFDVIVQLIENGPETVERDAVLDAMITIKKEKPIVFDSIKDFSIKAASSTAGRLLYDLLSAVP